MKVQKTTAELQRARAELHTTRQALKRLVQWCDRAGVEGPYVEHARYLLGGHGEVPKPEPLAVPPIYTPMSWPDPHKIVIIPAVVATEPDGTGDLDAEELGEEPVGLDE